MSAERHFYVKPRPQPAGYVKAGLRNIAMTTREANGRRRKPPSLWPAIIAAGVVWAVIWLVVGFGLGEVL